MNKTAITEKLKSKIETAISSTQTLSDDKFFGSVNNKWSIAENLVHLSKAAKSFNQLLAMPKAAIANLGKPTSASRSYDELVAFYHKTLANFTPSGSIVNIQIADNQRDKADILERFEKQHKDLLLFLNDWTEEELENYVAPHPALGKITMREMYYFMAYHIGHHQAAIDKIMAA